MALYRFYWINAGGHILRAENIECASDQAAEAVAARRKGNYRAIEVWQERRRVVRVGVTDKPD